MKLVISTVFPIYKINSINDLRKKEKSRLFTFKNEWENNVQGIIRKFKKMTYFVVVVVEYLRLFIDNFVFVMPDH